MTLLKRVIIIGIIVILTTVGLPLIKREAQPVQADQIYFNETLEYQTAKKLASSNLKMNCKSFADLWKVLFADSECRKFKTNIGTMHWECRVVENFWVDANWDLRGSIRIYKK